MTTPHLPDDLKRDEGCKLVAYQDTLDIWTVGVGHAHVAPGTVWTQAQCDDQLAKDIAIAEGRLDDGAPWWRSLDDVRQDVMVNLCFNMGWGNGSSGLSSFKNTLACIKAGDYAGGAQGLLNSKWAGQVHDRSKRLADQLRTGVRSA